MKLSTRQIALTAVLLALAICSQFLKNISVYLTGPFINLVLIITTFYCGLAGGTIIALVTPVTSYLITGSPLMSAIPLLIPAVMLGNWTLVFTVWMLHGRNRVICVTTGAVLKALVMGVIIAMIILPVFGPKTQLPPKALETARKTFSVTQLVTALIGGALAVVIAKPLDKFMQMEER